MILFSFVWWRPIRHVLIINEMTSLIIKKGRPTEFTLFGRRRRRCVPFVIRFECLLIQRTVNNIKGNSLLRLHRPLLIRDSCRVLLFFFVRFFSLWDLDEAYLNWKSRGSRPIEKRCMHTQQNAQATRSAAREWCWIYIPSLQMLRVSTVIYICSAVIDYFFVFFFLLSK